MIVHFAWLLETTAFCGKQLAPEDMVATPYVIALPDGAELCEACRAAPEPPEPEYVFKDGFRPFPVGFRFF